jgi:hypothetical protein
MQKNVIRMIVGIAVVFASGVVVGQRQSASKFEKYFQPTSVSSLDFAMLQANIDLIREYVRDANGIPIPKVVYDPKQDKLHGSLTVDQNFNTLPVNQARMRLLNSCLSADTVVKRYMPELQFEDFVLTVNRRVLIEQLDRGVEPPEDHELFAECRNGNVLIGK